MNDDVPVQYEKQQGWPEEDHPHQLVPMLGGRYKTVLKGPPGTGIGDLHCDLEPYIEGDRPATVSHSGWAVSEEQIEMLKAGAHIRLGVHQHPIPPLHVAVEPPVDETGVALRWIRDTDDGSGFWVREATAHEYVEKYERGDFINDDEAVMWIRERSVDVRG